MPLVKLTPDETDDLIYCVRAGEQAEMESAINELSQKYNTKASVIIASTTDNFEPEEEGGTGCGLYHYAAANGNSDILDWLNTTLAGAEGTLTPAEIKETINKQNYSGNTPLHWAALNAHIKCVELLVAAGADVSIKNTAGHDAVFLAERADWSAQAQAKGRDEAEDPDEVEITIGEGEGEGEGEQATQDAGPKTKGREVVEWLLANGEPANPQAEGSEE
ncbi:ankyrin repeat-containing domain protein [Aspergillus venezuelensis]